MTVLLLLMMIMMKMIVMAIIIVIINRIQIMITPSAKQSIPTTTSYQHRKVKPRSRSATLLRSPPPSYAPRPKLRRDQSRERKPLVLGHLLPDVGSREASLYLRTRCPEHRRGSRPSRQLFARTGAGGGG